MDEINDGLWAQLARIPQLLDQYSGYSYPLLAVLLVGGLLLVGIALARSRGSQEKTSGLPLTLGLALLFFSAGGFYLKWMGGIEAARARAEFIEAHRAPQGEHWLLVFDFELPGSLDDEARARQLSRMKLLVDIFSEVLLENLPEGFEQPRIVRVPAAQSPWESAGVGQHNFEQVLEKLDGLEIMWGRVDDVNQRAKAFLGLAPALADDLDRIMPLSDFPLDANLRREHEFSDGQYRLLGAVTLGLALSTYRLAETSGDAEHRRALYLQAAQQFNRARQLVNNRREDPTLKRTLFSARVDELIDISLQQAGVAP